MTRRERCRGWCWIHRAGTTLLVDIKRKKRKILENGVVCEGVLGNWRGDRKQGEKGKRREKLIARGRGGREGISLARMHLALPLCHFSPPAAPQPLG